MFGEVVDICFGTDLMRKNAKKYLSKLNEKEQWDFVIEIIKHSVLTMYYKVELLKKLLKFETNNKNITNKLIRILSEAMRALDRLVNESTEFEFPKNHRVFTRRRYYAKESQLTLDIDDETYEDDPSYSAEEVLFNIDYVMNDCWMADEMRIPKGRQGGWDEVKIWEEMLDNKAALNSYVYYFIDGFPIWFEKLNNVYDRGKVYAIDVDYNAGIYEEGWHCNYFDMDTGLNSGDIILIGDDNFGRRRVALVLRGKNDSAKKTQILYKDNRGSWRIDSINDSHINKIYSPLYSIDYFDGSPEYEDANNLVKVKKWMKRHELCEDNDEVLLNREIDILTDFINYHKGHFGDDDLLTYIDAEAGPEYLDFMKQLNKEHRDAYDD